MFSSIIFIVTGVVYHVEWVIFINILYALVNAVQIYFIFLERSAIAISEKYRTAYHVRFLIMQPREFLFFVRLGKTETVKPKTIICEENAHDDILYFILSGTVNVYQKHQLTRQLQANYFIGEMRYLTHRPMSAQVIAEDQVEYIKWDYKALNELKEKKPSTYIKVLTILGSDLVSKIQHNLNE